MSNTVGGYLIEALAMQGVRVVFGIPGVHNIELYRTLSASGMRHVSARHEQGLGFMADGYARVARTPGVCLTITGPGLTNIATAMAQAYADSVPMLVIASQNRTGEIGTARGFLHELPDQMALAGLLSGASHHVGNAAALPPTLAAVFAHLDATRPRPAYIEIPRDILASDARELPPPQRIERIAAPRAEPGALAAAAALLAGARSPLILAGGGAIGAAGELRRVAERLGAPVVMTVNARGLLAPDHPLAVPMSPSLAPIRALIGAADTVLAVGTELGPTDYDMYAAHEFPQPANLVRIDLDAQQLHRNARPRIALLGDAAATLSQLLLRELGPHVPQRGVHAASQARTAALVGLSAPMRRELYFLNVIRDTLPRALLVGDSTQPVYAGNLAYAAPRPGSWFNSATGFGSLGYALPAATGAGLAAADVPIVCLVGDGGLQFSLGELGVPRDVDAWLAIVVWNNGGYGEIRSSMLAAGIEPQGVLVGAPDFARLAQAYGYGHRSIDDLSELTTALRDFGLRRQVVMLEIRAARFE